MLEFLVVIAGLAGGAGLMLLAIWVGEKTAGDLERRRFERRLQTFANHGREAGGVCPCIRCAAFRLEVEQQ